jgi:hypothetical protein
LAVLDGVEEGALACVAHIRIDGATPPAARHAAVLRFQQSAECRVALIAISAGGTALTLTAASHVVFLELYWTPAALLQAEDRCHRIGQRSRVQVTYLLGAGTLDEALWAALKRKSRVLGETLEGRAEACATTGVAGALSSSSSSSAAAAASASATSTGLASGLLLAAGAVRRLDALGHVCDGATSRFFTAPATAPPLPARAAALRKIGANVGVPINLVEEEEAAEEEEGEVVAEQHRLVEQLLLGEMDGLAHVMTVATSTEGAVDASEDVDHDDAIDGDE